jgi:8-hydroxy-5-deazaflavin:NADPH oxidoreductase
VRDAAQAGDIVIVTIPMRNIAQLPAGLFEGVADDVVVVDTGNYYPQQRDGRIDEIEDGMTESRWTSQRLGRPVVKAFNNIYARHLLEKGKPKGAADRIALPVAGDGRRAKDVIIRLLDQLGFDGVDAGSLDESWRQQPGTPVYGTDHDAAGVRKALTEAKPKRTEAFRASGATAGRR